MKLDDDQFFLKKTVLKVENMGVYCFPSSHTSLQAALDTHAYIEHTKRVPAAPNRVENPSSYDVQVSISSSKQKLTKACTTETAGIPTGYGDMSDASIARLKEKAYVFSWAEMGRPCSFRCRAPALGQQ